MSLYKIPGYHMISTGHYASNHGGLVIYLHNKWDYVLKTCNTVSKLWERQIIEVYDPTNTFKRNIIIGNIYRPPYNSRYQTDTFLEEFNSTLSEFHFNRQNTYFCGDYNIDLLKVKRFQLNEEYFDSILTAGYIPTITLPTRLSENSTLIDNVLTNNFSNNGTKAFILNIHISDHQPIMLFTNDQTPATKTHCITVRTNSDEAKHRFRTSFHDKNVIDKLDLINPDPNTNYEILEKELKESHHECFPVRTVKFNAKRHKKKSWMTLGILRSINHRNTMYKKLKQMRSDSENYVIKRSNFNHYRNTLKKTMIHAKRFYYKNMFDRFKHDMKKTWSIISETLSRNKQNRSLPETMTINGQDCCNTQVIAEHFNTFFATIGAQNEAHIRTHQGSHFRDYLTRHTEARFAFHEIHNYETIRIIKNIKLSSSNSHDGISSELLKLISDDISKCITLIINQSLMSGIFPDKLKIAKVTPIYKKNDKKQVTNYRPISVLPVVSKVIETVIADQLNAYFIENHLFSPQQYGFRKKSSTELAAIELLDRLLDQLNQQKIPINFHLDLSKAFDGLNHNILIDKLVYYGVTGKSKDLLSNYLTERQQYVQIGDYLSSKQLVRTGVPQGSVLGLCYLIYLLMTLFMHLSYLILYCMPTTQLLILL